jgi:hypothetical protein
MIRFCLAIVITCFGIGHVQAQEAEIAKFVAFKTGEAIDDRCHFLKKFERDRFYDVEDALLGRLHFHANRGKISDEDYNAEYDALVAQARQTADAIACTDNQGAGAYILPLRGDIANLIYQDLLLAFDGGELTVEQQTAARAYEAMIAPLYGQNWQGFVDYGRRQAQARLEEAQEADQADDIYGFSLFGLNELGGNVVGDDPASVGTYNRSALIAGSVRVTDDIFFEVMAEQLGYRRISRRLENAVTYIDGLTDRTFNPVLDFWKSPERYAVMEGGADIYAAFTLLADGGVRVMTYGQAAIRLAEGSVTILVHPPLDSERTSDFAYLRSQEWRDATTIYRGERVSEPCLGGPCFAFPTAMTDTILSGASGQAFQFFFSERATPEMPAPGDTAIHTGFNYQLLYRRDFLAAGER